MKEKTDIIPLTQRGIILLLEHCRVEQKDRKNVFENHLGVAINTSSNIHPHLQRGISILDQIISYSALFHDLGKNEKGFQHRLDKKSNEKAPIRHEFLSLVYLFNKEFFFGDKSWNKFFTKIKAKELKNWFEKLINNVLFGEPTIEELILYIILTHHKQTSLESIYESKSFMKNKKLFSKILFSSLKDTYYPEYSLDNLNKIEIFKKDDDAFLRILENSIENKETLNLREKIYYYLISKAILNLADYYVSSLEGDKLNKKYLRANKYQLLTYHLKSVQESVKKLIKEIFKKENRKINVKKDYYNIDDKRFEWQNKIYELIINSDKSKPFLIFNKVETGGGKTIGNAKIAQALDSSSYIVNYPLRNLTIQTAKVFYEITDKNKVALVIGDLDEKEIDPEVVYYEETPKEIDHHLKSENHKMFLTYPVVIATIDYLMQSIKNKKSKNILVLLKILKSDTIIIDEIDNLSFKDMMATMKLFYLLGVFKKNVIVSTATLNEIHQKYIKKFYEAGIKGDYHLIDFNQNKIIKNKKVLWEKEEETKQIIKASYLEKSLDEEIDEFANNNYVDLGDYKVSVGLVKIFFKNECVKTMLEYLQKADENTFVILFHSDMPLKYKDKIDEFLTKILNRKDLKKNKEILRNFIRNNQNKRTFNRNKVIKIVVFATPLIDTGKDYDFDWAINEFRNIANSIQTAGRVNRHRRIETDIVNFKIMLSDNLRNKTSMLLKDKREELEEKLRKWINEIKGNFSFKVIQNSSLYKEELFFLEEKMKEVDKYLKDSIFFESAFEDTFIFRENIAEKVMLEIKNKELVNYAGKVKRFDNEYNIEYYLPDELIENVEEDKIIYSDYVNDIKYYFDYYLGIFKLEE